jgi:hypothetical protein
VHAANEWSYWRRLRALTGREIALSVEAWGRLGAAALRLRLAPARAVASAVGGLKLKAGSAGAASPAEMACAVGRAAARHPASVTCLPRALALQRMLARRGIDGRLRLGVRRVAGELSAHAWIEVAGAPLGEPAAIEARFLPLIPSD